MNNNPVPKTRNYTAEEVDRITKTIRECRKAGMTNEETAQYMNAEGLRKTRGDIFTKADVDNLITRLRRKGKRIPRYKSKYSSAGKPQPRKVVMQPKPTPQQLEGGVNYTEVTEVVDLRREQVAGIGMMFFMLGAIVTYIVNNWGTIAP